MMSAYVGDTLLYRDRVFRLATRPLETWFRLIGQRPALRHSSEQPPDGPDYAATWEIGADGLLRLVGLTGSWPDTNPLALGHLFPLAEDSVVASWFSGVLRGIRAGPVGAALAAVQEPCHRDFPGHGVPALLLADLALEIRCGCLLDASGEPQGSGRPVDESPRWAATLV